MSSAKFLKNIFYSTAFCCLFFNPIKSENIRQNINYDNTLKNFTSNNKSTINSNKNQLEKNSPEELTDKYIIGPGDKLGIYYLGSDFNPDKYIIAPGDKLGIYYLGSEFNNNLNQFNENFEYLVLSDGTINLPIVGTVELASLSFNQAKDLLDKKYSKELISPNIYLKLITARKVKVSIIGEISRPGIYSSFGEISKPSKYSSPTLLDALVEAGGVTKDANLKDISLLRKLPGKEGKYKKGKINLLDIILNGDQTQNPFLYDGDIIKISKAEIIDEADRTKISSSNLSPATINVRIIGSVNDPGSFKLASRTPLSQAIYNAGGPIAWGTNKGNIQLIRINSNGSATLKKYKINLLSEVNEETNPILLDGDIVKVNPNIISKTGSAIKTVVDPITGLVSAITLFNLLN